MRILILCADASSNSLVRVHPIANVLQRNHDVTVSGFRSSRDIFPPYATEFNYHTLRTEQLPSFVRQIDKAVRHTDADLVYAFKPLSTSLWTGLAARRRLSVPLVLDIEDWELGWYLDRGAVGALKHLRHVRAANGLLWTAVNELLARRADHRFVVSTFLQRRFGGTILRHGPDTEEFAPERSSPSDALRELGLPDFRYILFAGTAMRTKGLEEVLLSLESLKRSDVRLLLVGSVRHDSGYVDQLLERFGDRMTVIGPRPHSEMPLFLAAASLVVLPQVPTRETAAQIPGKVFEAMAMGLPVIATAVSDLPSILDGCGIVVPPGDRAAMQVELGRLLDDEVLCRQLGEAARRRCIERYGWDAMERTLERDLRTLVADGPGAIA